MKRTVICKSRDFSDYHVAMEYIFECLEKEGNPSEIVVLSGGCRGSDSLGEFFAKKYGYTVEKHNANWKKYGRAAGPIRNREMAMRADIVICFWDGNSRGTKTMIDYAEKENKKVYIKYINEKTAIYR